MTGEKFIELLATHPRAAGMVAYKLAFPHVTVSYLSRRFAVRRVDYYKALRSVGVTPRELDVVAKAVGDIDRSAVENVA